MGGISSAASLLFLYSSQQSFMIGGVYPGPLNEFGTDQTSP